MAPKRSILDTLGESALLEPQRVNAALAANDRAKYFFTLLQTARLRAARPEQRLPDLRAERIASGVEDEGFDVVAEQSTTIGEDAYRIPGASRIVRQLFDDVREMLEPLAESEESKTLAGRYQDVAGNPDVDGDRISGALIDRMTSADRARGDSLHLVVMDAHKALNRMQRALASESVDGASAYAIDETDRRRISAFMRGVGRTSALKFDHPGLATTATRSHGRLVIQNDIGTTDAHVLVVHVEARSVTVTYTDVHLARLIFFEGLFESFAVEWEDARSRSDASFAEGVYHLGLGRYTAPSDADCDRFLEFLGSRVVFLIDWNKARKRLRHFVSNGEAIGLLRWASEEELGHMAFLLAGGEQLVFDAIEFATKGHVPIGAALSDVLGGSAREFLRFVLRVASEGMRRGEPEAHIQDAVRAEAMNFVRSHRQDLFDIATEHAAWIHEIAETVRQTLLGLRGADPAAMSQSTARRAKTLERNADACLNRAREAQRNAEGSEFFVALLEAADDVADELEEATFHVALLPEGAGRAALLPPLDRLCQLTIQGVQTYVRAMEAARHVRRNGAREDMRDLLDAIHGLAALERRSDEAEREVKTTIAGHAGDYRTLHFASEIARNLEQATDALMHCGLRLRDNTMSEVLRA